MNKNSNVEWCESRSQVLHCLQWPPRHRAFVATLVICLREKLQRKTYLRSFAVFAGITCSIFLLFVSLCSAISRIRRIARNTFRCTRDEIDLYFRREINCVHDDRRLATTRARRKMIGRLERKEKKKKKRNKKSIEEATNASALVTNFLSLFLSPPLNFFPIINL